MPVPDEIQLAELHQVHRRRFEPRLDGAGQLLPSLPQAGIEQPELVVEIERAAGGPNNVGERHVGHACAHITSVTERLQRVIEIQQARPRASPEEASTPSHERVNPTRR